ncbi:MAG: hypothetical protein V8T87_09160 [Victivallales bacterium]
MPELMCDDMVYFGGFCTCSCPCCRARLGFELPPAHDTTFWGDWGNSRCAGISRHEARFHRTLAGSRESGRCRRIFL